MDTKRAEEIARLNDKLRLNGTCKNGQILLSRGLAVKSHSYDSFHFYSDIRNALKSIVFTEHNDPYKERDFAEFTLRDGTRCFFKIDYYQKNTAYLSPNPEDEEITQRVMTLMLCEEY